MKIKITSPCKIGGRALLPGESIDVPEGEALEYIGNRWAIIAEGQAEMPIRKVKRGNRSNNQ